MQESEFAAVIQQHLEFRQGFEQQSRTLRLTTGEESGESLAASLTASGQLRLSATASAIGSEEEEERESDEEEEREGAVSSVNGGERQVPRGPE